MHNVSIRSHIVERVLARRGRIHWFERLEPRRSALLVIDMQATFCQPGGPAEVPLSRAIVPGINWLTKALRELDVPVVWVLHGNRVRNGVSDWEAFFDHVVAAPEMRRRTQESLAADRQQVWPELEVAPQDLKVVKNRYSAFAHGASPLERMLRERGVDTVLIAGTKTNVCCDSTGRDAMMRDLNAVLVSDCCAALSDEEHLAALETFIQQFGDVMTSDEVVARLKGRPAAAEGAAAGASSASSPSR